MPLPKVRRTSYSSYIGLWHISLLHMANGSFLQQDQLCETQFEDIKCFKNDCNVRKKNSFLSDILNKKMFPQSFVSGFMPVAKTDSCGEAKEMMYY